MNRERDRTLGNYGVKPGIQVAAVVHKPVRAIRSLSRVAHTRQVGSQAAGQRLHIWYYVPPQVCAGRVAVEEYDGIPTRICPGVHVGEFDTGTLDTVSGEGVVGGNGMVGHGGISSDMSAAPQ